MRNRWIESKGASLRGPLREYWLRLSALLAATIMLLSYPPPVGAALPDGRGYEMVSPVEKDGNEAGFDNFSYNGPAHYGVANADGSRVLYSGTGPIGEPTSGFQQFTIARQSSAGWTNTVPLPRGVGQLGLAKILGAIHPSSDLLRIAFLAENSYVAGDPDTPNAASIYRTTEGGPLAWVGKPTVGFSPSPPLGDHINTDDFGVLGGTPDLGTVDFVYDGTLIPSDASRAPHIPAADGLYEWSNGALSAADVLPDGTVDPYGAIPAGIGKAWHSVTSDDTNNQISEDGTRLFFVSPTPGAGSEEPPELYVRERLSDGQHKTILVSRSTITAQPASSILINNGPTFAAAHESYAYASPDGSHVYFVSNDRLTADAPAENAKEYVFDVDSETLSYLPGVLGPIVASSTDGSRFLFEDVAAQELDLWAGGHVVRVTQLPPPPATSTNTGEGQFIAPARATRDGGIFVFAANSPIPGGFNNAGGYTQVYRYDSLTGSLACASCPPRGTAPSGDANMSNDDRSEDGGDLVGSRGVSSDANRIFFDTPDQLLPEDVNGVRDVYEWENGHVYLLSSGQGHINSYFIDNSESGDNVFFATAAGLVSSDLDGGYDVYDARSGAAAPPEPPLPCSGEGCQGAPATSPLFAPPASLTTTPGDDLPPPVVTPVKKKPKAKPSKHKAKSKSKQKHHKPAKKARKAKAKARRAASKGRGR